MTMKQPDRDAPTPSPSPLVVQGEEAFRRDLPDLLKKYRGQWVAYVGKERVEVGKKNLDVYQRCLDRGFPEGDFVVYCVEPEATAPLFIWEYSLLPFLTGIGDESQSVRPDDQT